MLLERLDNIFTGSRMRDFLGLIARISFWSVQNSPNAVALPEINFFFYLRKRADYG